LISGEPVWTGESNGELAFLPMKAGLSMTTATANFSTSTEPRRTANSGPVTDFEKSVPAVSPRVLRMLTLLNQEFDAQSPLPE
jgi:hypothetical protein